MKIDYHSYNMQDSRKKLEESPMKNMLQSLYPDARILIGNYGYIVVPRNMGVRVRKYYREISHYKKEIQNYTLLKEYKICTPNIYPLGNEKIIDDELYVSEFSNIRIWRPAFKEMTDISPAKMGELLEKIHGINFQNGKVYLHSNLHHSNFFEDQEGALGIFDCVSMHLGDLEYDFSTIYVNSDYNKKYIEEILQSYKFREFFHYKKMFIYAILKLRECIKASSIDEETRNYYKYDLLKIQEELGNII